MENSASLFGLEAQKRKNRELLFLEFYSGVDAISRGLTPFLVFEPELCNRFSS